MESVALLPGRRGGHRRWTLSRLAGNPGLVVRRQLVPARHGRGSARAFLADHDRRGRAGRPDLVARDAYLAYLAGPTSPRRIRSALVRQRNASLLRHTAPRVLGAELRRLGRHTPGLRSTPGRGRVPGGWFPAA